MRLRLALLFLLAFPIAASASSEYLLPIAGSVGNFRTDVRIYNPASTDAHATLIFTPVGNQNNGAAFSTAVSITIPATQEVSYDDVISKVFGASGIGAVYVNSDLTLLITCRIYAQTDNGTLGQGYQAQYTGNVPTAGVLLQLRADSAFRTNIGVVNIQNTLANVTWTLYDKNHAKVSSGTTLLQPFAVIGPTSITSGFFFDPGTADLSDAYVTFTSDNAVAAYASVVDNATTDPTFFPAMRVDGP